MAEVIQRPFMLVGSNSTQVYECLTYPDFVRGLANDAVHVESDWRPPLLGTSHQIQVDHGARMVFTNHHGMIWKDASVPSFEALSKVCVEGQLKQAMQEVMHMAREGVCIPSNSLFQVLQWCINENDLAAGYDVQYIIKICGLESDAFIGSHLIRMFSFFRRLPEAKQVFRKLLNPNVFSWSAIILAHVNMGKYEQAIHYYFEMQESGVEPDGHIFVAVLKACSGMGNMEQGYWVHLNIIKCGFELEVYVGSTLIDMYVKCGNLEKACKIFDKLPERNVVTWSVLIAGYTQHGHGEEALALFEQMHGEGVKPNLITFASILKACSHVETGRQIHTHIVGYGLESEIIVGNSLIDMYVKCARLTDANMVFDRLHKRDIVAWNSLIAGYCQDGHGQDALEFFEQMQQEGVQPNLVTFVCVLKACVTLGALKQGMQIHSCMIENEFQLDVYVGSSLIDMYIKCGRLRDAQAVFDRLPKHNVVTWSALISGFSQHGHEQEAFEHFEQMKWEGIEPNDYTLVSILKACSNISALEQGRQIHMNFIEIGLEFDTYVGNALIDMYAKCGSLQGAYKVFNKLPNRDVVSWSTLIAGCAQHQEGQKALQHYAAMQNEGIEPNMVTFITVLKACSSIVALEHGRQFHGQITCSGFNFDIYIGSALIDMYAKCGCLEESHMVFHRLPKHDAVVWCAMITGYAQHSNYQMAFRYFEAMQVAGVKPDAVTFLCILSACSHACLVHEGCLLFKAMRETYGITPRLEHFNCMVDLLGNANLLIEAKDLLETIPFGPNIVGWMSLLTSCRMHVDVNLGRHCFNHVVTLDKGNVAGYVLMSNIYSSAGMNGYGKKTDELRLLANGWKKPGKAYIEVDNVIHSFVVGDKDHQKSEEIYAKLKLLNIQMKMEGHGSHLDPDFDPVLEEREEDDLCGHCEKLALSFGLLYTSQGTTIRISKNLRMCAVCHSDTEFISKAERREIFIVDACRVHHFQHGVCPCNIYSGENLLIPRTGLEESYPP